MVDTDPLAEFKRVCTIDEAGTSPAVTFDDMRRWVAAWEKERERRNAYTSPCDVCGTTMLECCPKCDDQGKATALRAEVLKVAEELERVPQVKDYVESALAPGTHIYTGPVKEWATRLRKACE